MIENLHKISQSQIKASNTDNKLVEQCLYEVEEIADMIASNLPEQDPKAFARETMDIIKSPVQGKEKWSLSDTQAFHVLGTISQGLVQAKENKLPIMLSSNLLNNIKHDGLFNHRTSLKSLSQSTGLLQLGTQENNIGNYIYELLPAYIIDKGSALDQENFLLRKLCPPTSIGARNGQIDRGQKVFGRSVPADYQGAQPLQNGMNSYSTKFATGRFSGGNVRFNPEEMLFTREKGTMGWENGRAGLAQRLAYETRYMENRLQVGVNLDIRDMFLKNQFSYSANQTTNIVSAGIPTANVYKVSAQNSIGTYSKSTKVFTPNPNSNALQEISFALATYDVYKKFQSNIKSMIVDPQVYIALMNSPASQARLTQFGITRNDPAEAKGLLVPYYTTAQYYNFEIVQEPMSWTNSLDAENDFLMYGASAFDPNATDSDLANMFNGILAVDVRDQNAPSIGTLMISPEVTAGDYITGGTTGMAIRLFDFTNITPFDPHLELMGFMNYAPVPLSPKSILTIDFNVEIVA